jgi:hypothetical protein
MLYRATCHCGAVEVEVEAPDVIECESCNCSMCARAGFLHLIVPASKFRLVKGEDALTTYTFNTGVAQHRFCSVCGIKVFYIPRSNPDGFDVNVRCLEPKPREVRIRSFDGLHWEQHAHTLAHLSRELTTIP